MAVTIREGSMPRIRTVHKSGRSTSRLSPADTTAIASPIATSSSLSRNVATRAAARGAGDPLAGSRRQKDVHS